MPRKLSEACTRKEMIDPQSETVGWYLRNHSKVKIEIPVDRTNLRWLKGLRGCISEAGRQINGLFESLLDTSFIGNR